MEKKSIDRIGCHVTAKCNLRCNKCATFIPKLYKNGGAIPEYCLEDTIKSFDVMFHIYEHVNIISVSGGEPLLYPKLAELLLYFKEKDSYYNKIEIFTNGTLPVPEDVLAVLSVTPKFMLFVDDYGPTVSVSVNKVREQCDACGVNYKVRTYYGENAHLGGWVDRDALKEKLTIDQAKYNLSRCFNGHKGARRFTIFGDVISFCSKPYCGLRTKEIPEEDVLHFSLVDGKMTVDEINEKLDYWNEMDYNPGCAWCYGLGVYDNVERYTPGEQLEH